MMKGVVGCVLSLSVVACAAQERTALDFEDDGLYDEANPSFGRGTAEYRATLSVSSSPTSDVLTALSGWACTTTATLEYTEDQLDHRGQPRTISLEQASSLGLYSAGDVDLPFTRSLDNKNPSLDVVVHHVCARTIYEPCPSEDDLAATCPKTESFAINWTCEQPDLPDVPGQSTTQECESRSSFWPFLSSFSWAPFFRDLKIHTSVELVDLRTTFDYNNCDSQNAEPFYLRLSQGVGGHWGEDDFVLYIEVDGKPIVKTPSKTGLYSLALAYCPDRSQDTITVNLRAVEEDLFWDDEYTADPQSTNMALGRGEVRQVTLHRGGLFGSSSSAILLEVFGERAPR